MEYVMTNLKDQLQSLRGVIATVGMVFDALAPPHQLLGGCQLPDGPS